jgi:diguanylate cyclase (GGDEF)-like protein
VRVAAVFGPVRKDEAMRQGGKTGRHSRTPVGTILIQELAFAVAMAVGLTPAAMAAQPAPLTTLRAIRALSEAEAGSGVPVAFEGTVTFYDPSNVGLFVQDGGQAIYVETKRNENLVPGDRVLVKGRTRSSFNADVLSNSVTVLHHGALPAAVPADFEQLIRAKRDCMRVKVHATVRSADTVAFGGIHDIYLKLQMAGGSIDATAIGSGAWKVDQLLDAEVEVTGVVSGKFDSKMQLIGIVLEVPSLADVKVVKRAAVSPDSLPITPMDQVLSSSYVNDLSRRVRVQGTITYYQPGSAVVLQNGNSSLWISTQSSNPMRIGDVAIATGFPDASDGYLALTDGEIEDTNVYEPIEPQEATWSQLATWNSGDPNGHQSDLVSFDGRVVVAVREDAQDEFVLETNGKLFTAIYRHPPGYRTLPPMRRIALGTRIRVSGICMAVRPNAIDPTQEEVPFDILLRSFDDIAVVARPSMLNVRNLIVLAGFLLVLLVGVGVREWLMERRIRRENAAVAHIERSRGRILEDINGSRPLAEILEQITELVAFRLQGTPCWCQIADGAQLGNMPADLTPFRVIQEPIASRSGPPLGTLSAAFIASTKPQAIESETVSRAAALATLAIETRRLYTDLVHRSKFDLLTDIHNRFSLEEYLDEQIEAARQNASIFGLIYIDLNDFKQVNDVYGHQVGDLYLCEVAIRVKGQLRAVDMLARLGGDEFAVLVPRVRNRAEVDAVASRIEHCLEEPFAVEGSHIYGSGSIGIALYPEDGTTRDSLFNTADAAMYVNKHIRKESR